MERFVAIVSGRVQGVTYRSFIERKARHLAIVGEVRNLPDFTVRVIAEGPRPRLEQLLTYIRKGPFLATVRDVAIAWESAQGEYASFDTVYE